MLVVVCTSRGGPSPVVTVTPVDTFGSAEWFDLTTNEDGVTFQCMLTKDTVEVFAWASCTSPKTYTVDG